MLHIIDLTLIPKFALIFARILAFLVTLPLFSYRTIPLPFRLGLAFYISLLLVTTLDEIQLELNMYYIFLLIKEIGVGLLIGLIAYIVLSVVQIAGGFIDFQMGFAIANVIDPQTGAQSPLIGQYFYMIVLLFMFSVDGHHLLINGMIHSFDVIALDQLLSFGGDLGNYIMTTFNKLFIIAFQISIPLVGSLFLVDVALGIIARAVPQLNVFVVGLPLKITVSFTVLFFFMSLFISLVNFLFQTLLQTMNEIMFLLGGG